VIRRTISLTDKFEKISVVPDGGSRIVIREWNDTDDDGNRMKVIRNISLSRCDPAPVLFKVEFHAGKFLCVWFYELS